MEEEKKDNEPLSEEKAEPLSEEKVFDVFEFAKAWGGGSFSNIVTPMLLNERMKEINLSPIQATETSLNSAMADPRNSENQLQAFSQDFEIQSQVYKRLLSYLTNMLSFDLTYECINAKPEEYTKPAYKKSFDRVKAFFDRFDYRYEFSNAVSEMMRNEAYFCAPRFDMEKIVLQELPSSPDYTKITGRWSYGFLFSFNMRWFVQGGVDIDLYPDFFKKKYAELYNEGGDNYNPSAPLGSRGISSWVNWQDIPPDVGFAFKFSPTQATRVPYFTGLFLDLIQQPLMRALQKNTNMSAASRLIIGEIGVLKETQSNVKDKFNISPALLGNFLALVKSAIGDAMKTAALPLQNVQGIDFPSENEIYSSFLKTAMSSSGVNSNLIFTHGQKLTTIESQLSVDTDIQLMTSLYPQFEGFLNYYVNKNLHGKYKYKFHFEGAKFFNNRQQRFDKAIELANMGMVLPQKISAAMGMDPFEFQRQLEEAKALGFVDKLTPIISGFQQSGKDVGRPQKDESSLTESGEETRGSGANTDRGGSV